MSLRASAVVSVVSIALSLAMMSGVSRAVAQEAAASPETTTTAATPATGEEVTTSTEPAIAYEGETGPPADGSERPEVAEDARGEDVMAALTDALDEPGLEESTSTRRIVWRAEWPRYSFDEAVLTVGLGALLVASELLPNSSFTPNWRGGLLFDEGVRGGSGGGGLRLDTFAERDNARIAADVLMWVNMALPVVVDAFFATGIGDGNWDAAFQMGLISIEAYVVSLVVWRVTSLLARRQRPLDTACEAGDTSPHCDSRFATQSFFSNHAANAFTGAALTCLHHSAMPVFGDVGWDSTACVSATLLATAVGMLRVMSDHEYLTDVLTGAAVGWLSGYIVPWLLHYQGGARPELRAPIAIIPAPMISDDTIGLTAAGWF